MCQLWTSVSSSLSGWTFLTQAMSHELTLPQCHITLPQSLILSEWGFILNGCRRWWIAPFSWRAKCKNRKKKKLQKELKLLIDGVSKLGVYWYMFRYICPHLNRPIQPMALSFMELIFVAQFLFFVLFRSQFLITSNQVTEQKQHGVSQTLFVWFWQLAIK